MKAKIQYETITGRWEDLGGYRNMACFTEWWNAYIREWNWRRDRFGVPMLRAIDEDGRIVRGVGSEDYAQFVEMNCEASK